MEDIGEPCLGLTSLLQVPVSEGDDGDQLAQPGLLVHPGLLLSLVGEVSELHLRVVVVLVFSTGSCWPGMFLYPGEDPGISHISEDTRQLFI